jgi:hypothetical protein
MYDYLFLIESLVVKNKSILLGLISFEIKQDHVLIHLVEKFPEEFCKTKMYDVIGGNLFDFRI